MAVLKDLIGLGVRDTLPLCKLIPGVVGDNVVAHVVESNKGSVVFKLLFMGVFIGKYRYTETTDRPVGV